MKRRLCVYGLVLMFIVTASAYANEDDFPPKIDKIEIAQTQAWYSAMARSPEFKPAKSPVTGAFGFTLGDVFDATLPKWKADRVGGTELICYRVKPDKPIKQFSKYAIWVTADKNRIVMILAEQKYDTLEAATLASESVSAALVRKYGEPTMPQMPFYIHSEKLVKHNWRGAPEHSIMYIDFATLTEPRAEEELEAIDLDAL
jgi:hypothetical protein